MRVGFLALAACGRIGFDADAGNGGTDAAVPFVEPVGELDPAFGTAGITLVADSNLDVSIYAVVRRQNGYLGFGVHGNQSGSSAIAVIGFTQSGQPDLAFGTSGVRDIGPTANDFGYGAVRIDANRIAVNGDGAAGSMRDDFTLGIVDDSGVPDPSFGVNGFARLDIEGRQRDDTANRAAEIGSTIVACGIGGYNVSDSSFALARFDLGGALVPTWGTGGTVADELVTGAQDECFDVAALDGKVIAVGRSDDTRFVVLAYRETDGMRDTSFATSGMFTRTGTNTRALGVTTFAGDAVAVGQRNGTGFVLRLGPDGTPRSGFGTNGEVSLAMADVLVDVVVQPNDKLIVVGTAGSDGIVARMLADGSLDPSFGAGGVARVAGASAQIQLQSLALDPEGTIAVVGAATAPGRPRGMIARLR